MDIINNIIQKLGRSNYRIDNKLSKKEIFIILRYRLFQILRGFILKLKIKSSSGIIFKGRNVNIFHYHKIRAGKSLILEDNVTINALSIDGIIFGNNVTIQNNTIIECTGVISELGAGLIIGNNVGIAPNCFIQVRGNVNIGSNVLFGPGVYLFSENHNYSNVDKFINEQGTSRNGVIIKDGVWVGSRSIILDGVAVGENSIVAAGSVVTKNIPPFEIWGGVPAKFIKKRK